MNIKPTVSAILVVKNGEKYLARAIDSIICQTYLPTEIIIIDGNSTDLTKEIASSYPDVRYIKQVGEGIATAYNQGIEAAQSEFLAFHAHDDVWLQDKLQIQIDYLLQHPATEYTVSKIKFILEQGYAIPSGFKAELIEQDLTAYIMETLVVRKSLFDRIGKLDPEYSIAVDVDWFARVKDANIQGAVMPEVLLHKYLHDHNLSSNAAINNQNLLRIMRQSIQRQREKNETNS